MLSPEERALATRMCELAAEAYCVSAEQIASRTRRRPVMRARQAVIYALADRGWSSRRIQGALGIQQAAVIYAVGAVEMLQDDEQRETIRLLRGTC